MLKVNKANLLRHHEPVGFSDRFASGAVALLSRVAVALFGRRYGDRAVILETVAAVPPMVAAVLLHLRCLRRMVDDHGWIRTFMNEAENQRAHLMSFVAIGRPNAWERVLIAIAQGIFYNAYFLLHLLSPRTAHRMAGYIAEQGVEGYTRTIDAIESGARPDGAAPDFAIDYWTLPQDAKVSDMLIAMREDEAIHRDINHAFADALAEGAILPELPPEQI
jgi:ubiquinol oxidase